MLDADGTTTAGAFKTDGGVVHVTARRCKITGDAIIEFGRSYTLRLPDTELIRFNSLLLSLENNKH